MKHIEHIGIAVNNLEESALLFGKMLNTEPYKEEIVESEGVKTLFFKVGNVKIELLESSHPESPISKFIEKRGEGIHHLAFEVENIEDEMERLDDEGFQLLSNKPKDGADNKKIAFIHPKDSGRVLIEICQEKEKDS